MRKLFIGGNWKCNNTLQQSENLIKLLNPLKNNNKIDIIISPIMLHIPFVESILKKHHIQIAAQNISRFSMGANTGEISVEHLNDFNVNWVILGHSERREKFGDSNEFIKLKFNRAREFNKNIIYCIGEPLDIREKNQHITYIKNQIDYLLEVSDNYWDKIVIAYEPIWAIGTGKVANVDQVNEIHSIIREYIFMKKGEITKNTRIIYGGSVGNSNCLELINIKDVDGFLVGGASLKKDFIEIIDKIIK